MRKVLSGYIKGIISFHNSGLVMNYLFWSPTEKCLNDFIRTNFKATSSHKKISEDQLTLPLLKQQTQRYML